MGCAPSTCATVGTQIVPHKHDKLKPSRTRPQSEAKNQQLTSSSAKSRGKSSKGNKQKIPRSQSVFYFTLGHFST